MKFLTHIVGWSLHKAYEVYEELREEQLLELEEIRKFNILIDQENSEHAHMVNSKDDKMGEFEMKIDHNYSQPTEMMKLGKNIDLNKSQHN